MRLAPYFQENWLFVMETVLGPLQAQLCNVSWEDLQVLGGRGAGGGGWRAAFVLHLNFVYFNVRLWEEEKNSDRGGGLASHFSFQK